MWGSTFLTKRNSCHKLLFESSQKSPIEKLQISFVKHILGVSARVTNWAVLSETNRSPLLINIFFRILDYWENIKESRSPILQEVIKTAEHMATEGKTSWFTSVQKISEFLDQSSNPQKARKIVMNRILKEEWYTNHKKYSEGKLKLYTSIKERPGFESYLNMENSNLRKAITKFRISAHKFPIETGRYEKKAPNDRICPLCCDSIGDEVHYLIECNNDTIAATRAKFLEPFTRKWKGLDKITSEDFCKAILSCQNNDMLTEIGTLCLNIHETFANEAL